MTATACTDVAIYRPSAGQWFLTFSSGGGAVVNWGLSSDTPFAADFDGDGRADLAVYRPSSGHWFLKLSTNTFGAGPSSGSGAWQAICRSSPTSTAMAAARSRSSVRRRASGSASIRLPTAFVLNRQWGLNGDITVPHDYDGDGISDTAVFRPSIGQWFIRRSTNGTLLNVGWGLSGDIPR